MIKDKELQSILRGIFQCIEQNIIKIIFHTQATKRITFQRQKARAALIQGKEISHSLCSLAELHPTFDYLNTLRCLNAFSDLITTKFTKKKKKS